MEPPPLRPPVDVQFYPAIAGLVPCLVVMPCLLGPKPTWLRRPPTSAFGGRTDVDQGRRMRSSRGKPMAILAMCSR